MECPEEPEYLAAKARNTGMLLMICKAKAPTFIVMLSLRKGSSTCLAPKKKPMDDKRMIAAAAAAAPPGGL